MMQRKLKENDAEQRTQLVKKVHRTKQDTKRIAVGCFGPIPANVDRIDHYYQKTLVVIIDC